MDDSQRSSRIVLDRKNAVPLYLQIADQLKAMILRGDIFIGKKLPSTRKLAQTLGIDRSTVLLAYNVLYADGFIEAHVGRGTIVVDANNEVSNSISIPTSLRWEEFFTSCKFSDYDPILQKNNAWFDQDEIISLAGGDPARDIIPADEIKDIIARLCRNDLYSLLKASICQGIRPLRERLAEDMIGQGAAVCPEEIVITSGAVQAISLLSRTLLDPGDVVIVEKPTFYAALQIFKAAQAEIIGIPTDRDGMRIDALERVLSVRKAKLIYTMPNFQNPTGAVMNLERRKALLNLAYRYRIGIIEEDPFRNIYFGQAPPPSLKSMDKSAAVIYVGTMSKAMFPGFRIGWIICTRQLAKRLALVRQYEDMHPNTLGQHVFLEFMRTDRYEQHLSSMRKVIGRRRDAMLSALARHCSESLTWDKPEGGFYLWCRLKSGLKSNEVAEELLKKSVATLPGTAFFPKPEEGMERIRLAFSYETDERMDKGIRILGKTAGGLISDKKAKPDRSEIEIEDILADR